MYIKKILIGTVLLLAVTGFADTPEPNVVLIFADDLGYGDLGCYGATKVQTPNIDKLAAEGRRFTDAHSASAVCTPSRYALLTGEYPLRGNGGKGIWGPCSHFQPLLIDTSKLTLGKVFKNRGYATAALGKWHLGFGSEKTDWNKPLKPGPLELGFDYYFGVPKVNSGFPYVYVENHGIVGYDPEDPLVFGKPPFSETPTFSHAAGNKSANRFSGAKKAHEIYHDERIATTLVEKATKWIGENKEKPFFLYLATTNIHHPFTPAPRFKGTSQCGLYGDFIHELDWVVGEILMCLEENGLTDDTLVIFTSDNGGMFNVGGQDSFKAGHRQNGELLGFKFGAWEGGHRVPFITKWPGRIKPGTTSDQLICNVDMLATFAALTGQDIGKKQLADSVNVLPALVGAPATPLRKQLVLAPKSSRNLSIRKGKWMYIGAQGSGGFKGGPGTHAAGGPECISFVGSVNSDIENGMIKPGAPPAQLYDLEADVRQTQNLYYEYPEVVKEMSALLATYAPTKQTPVKKKKKTGRASKKKKPKAPADAAPKIDASPSVHSASFDFESGRLEPWKVVKGSFGHVIGNRAMFFRNKTEYNKQGEYYLTTLEPSPNAQRGEDQQTGVIVSPLFVPKGGKMTFRVGGGNGPTVYVALCTADGKEVQQARGVNDQVMQKAGWDLTPYAGKKMFIKIVDESTGGWGHITADNFQFDAEILKQYPEQTKQ
ncbi:MAG: arylsulfatase [Kiritimatiellales bacterium]|nr:arylsulfatase [Kiritimatiellales bacterium]